MARKLRKFIRDRRAITPVLSNLLLTVVAVAAMALATTATYVITTNLRETISERVIAEDVWFNNSTGSVDVYLRNVGQVAIQVSGVYVNHTSKSFTGSFRLEIGEHQWLNFSQSWVSGSVYYVDIVTKRGTHVGDYFTAS
jgi:FlaG/FlaF family flagellin (archaellin)